LAHQREIPGDADSAEAYLDRGVTLRKLGQLEAAIESYNQAIALKPDYAEAYSNRGNALKDLKRFDQAVASYDRAIAIKPDYADAYGNRGNALKEWKRLDEALASYDAAIALKPDYAILYSNRGNVLQELKRFDEAVASYDRAIALNPDYASAYANRGNALSALKRLEDAVASYDKALAFNPEHAAAYTNRGNALKELKRFDEALESYSRAIALEPDKAEFYSNRGNALQALERFEEAVADYDKTIALKPDYPESYNNRGVALNALMRFDDALSNFAAAVALKPDYAEAIWNRALVHLLTGHLVAGFHGYEARKSKREPVANRNFATPIWLGDSDIRGKTILVHWEQGLGDTIQFCRYIKLLEDAAATVLFAPQNPLKTLMRGLNAKPQIVDLDDATIVYDLRCPLMSLPLAFKTDLATIPSPKIYLTVDREKISKWRHALGKKTKHRISVVWNGNPEHKSDQQRSIALATLRQLFDERFQFISLQKEVRDQDRQWLADTNIAQFGDALEDFTDTAALCSLTDLVITVDTAAAHLAGALGLPVWVLLPWVPDWRWMLDRVDSPWYPSMRLYRQKMRGDWQGVLEQIQRELQSCFFDSAKIAAQRTVE